MAWIQSFADERCNGLGVVYQAANFYFIGSHVTVFWELDGDIYHDMLLTRKDTPRGLYLQANIGRAIQRKYRQFRYIFFLKRDWIKRLNYTIQPYPKPQQTA